MALFSQKTKPKTKAKETPHKTISDTIPYERVYENGIIEVRNGIFSQSYQIPDVNFKTLPDVDQIALAEKWSSFLNSFDDNVEIELTLYNREVDTEEFEESIYVSMRGDNLNKYREEYNHMLQEKMSAAKNNLETVKIFTVTLPADDIMSANEKFDQINLAVSDAMQNMTKTDKVQPMTLIERLDILDNIMQGNKHRPIYEQRVIDGHTVESFSLDLCEKQGITTKDIIAPDSFEFTSSKGKIGDRFMRSYYVKSYPNYIKGTVLTDFAQLPTTALISVHFSPYASQKSISMLKAENINVNTEIVNQEKRAYQNNVSGAAAVSPTLQRKAEEVEELMGKVTKEDVKLYDVTFVFTLFADTEEDLHKYEEQLMMIAGRNMITNISSLNLQQEAGFATSLPLGNNQLSVHRLMTSDTIAAIIPFDVLEVKQKNGLYYGQNAVSRNMIIYNRADDTNPNGCILGMPGSGKSFSAKREMLNVILNTDDEIYIIDPEREYKVLAEAFGGTVLEISSSSNVHINPFDINLGNQEQGSSALKIKCDFITSIIEIMIGGKHGGLSDIEKSIVERVALKIYEPHVQYLQRTRKNQSFETAPTLQDFYNELSQQPQKEAQVMALALERYVSGSLDTFNHHTNVKIDNRIMVYDVKDIGIGLTELGLQIALDNIWNKMIENKEKGLRTWIYIDEFYLMMAKPSSAKYISQIWKRARKWNGIPCAITQNVEDMLASPEARTVINNCNFVMMLGQAPINRQQLSQMMNISSAEQKYINSAKPGMGILNIRGNNIPLIDEFPKDTELYRIMSTKPKED